MSVYGDTQDIPGTQNTVANEYLKKPSAVCEHDTNDVNKLNCNLCFISSDKNAHAENELNVTDKRDIEMIVQMETARMLNITS